MDRYEIVAAYCRIYSREQLEAALRTALDNLASGVVVTKVSYEGGSTEGVIAGDTGELIAILNECLDTMDGKPLPSEVSYFDFSRQRLGT